MPKPNGGAAFPRPIGHNGLHLEEHRSSDDQSGMSLRDYFAAKAMPSALSASASSDGSYDYVAAAVGAYAVADAMLLERAT